MIARYAIVIVALLASGSAFAESLDAEAALRFVVDKLFAFTCFDGSRGTGRFYGDGSVIGTVQLRGSGPVRSLWLPAGTLKFKGIVTATVLLVGALAVERTARLMRSDLRRTASHKNWAQLRSGN